MSGHVRIAFNGVMSFLHGNGAYLSALEEVEERSIPDEILEEFAAFVRKCGHRYRGPQGGHWRSYLSVRLGGTHTRGGAGDTIPKKCLVLIPAYVKTRRRTEFG